MHLLDEDVVLVALFGAAAAGVSLKLAQLGETRLWRGSASVGPGHLERPDREPLAGRLTCHEGGGEIPG